MKSMSGKQLAKLLEDAGWILLRVQGSHHIYGKSGISVRISVPIHGNKSLKIGLLHNLLKRAGFSESLTTESSDAEQSNFEDTDKSNEDTAKD